MGLQRHEVLFAAGGTRLLSSVVGITLVCVSSTDFPGSFVLV